MLKHYLSSRSIIIRTPAKNYPSLFNWKILKNLAPQFRFAAVKKGNKEIEE
jgi:hypothetical protein